MAIFNDRSQERYLPIPLTAGSELKMTLISRRLTQELLVFIRVGWTCSSERGEKKCLKNLSNISVW